MNDDLPPQHLITIYKLKLRLARATILFLLFILLLLSFPIRFLMDISSQSQFALGKATGIAETVRLFLNKTQSNQQFTPRSQLQ